MKKIATHNKIFHADEITAIALLQIFTDDSYEITRVDHENKDFSQYDFVIDVGKQFDGVRLFDHHQYQGGKSSAGLIWDFIGQNSFYPKISKLIEKVDRNDTGVEKAKEFEYSSLIRSYNTNELHSQKQEEHFFKAIDFAQTVLLSMKRNQEAMEDAKDLLSNSYHFDHNPKILELEKFNPHWSTFINGMATPEIKAVVWEDEEEHDWKVKIVPKRLGSFELNHKALTQDPNMKFVHASGHFAIAESEEALKKYLQKNIK